MDSRFRYVDELQVYEAERCAWRTGRVWSEQLWRITAGVWRIQVRGEGKWGMNMYDMEGTAMENNYMYRE